MATTLVIGTLDTKGPELAYLESELARSGLRTLMVDVSCRSASEGANPAYPCTEVASRAGRAFDELAQLDRREAGQAMVAGARAIVEELYARGGIAGLIALGGSNGTQMACEIMQAVPIGFPKVMVSVVAASDPRQNVGTTDIVLINAITDMCLNRITRQVLSNASAALAGMVRQAGPAQSAGQQLQVGATVLGLTEACVLETQAALQAEGAEVLAFHTNGIGGVAFEGLIAKGLVDVALDLTTNEVGNHLLGGVFDAGPTRLEAAGARGIPQVVAPGATDFVNFWGANIPAQYRDRRFILHNAQNTLMRTTAEESRAIGRAFAEKLSRSAARVAVLVPLKGFSGNDKAGGRSAVTVDGKLAGPWHDPQADLAFSEGLRSAADPAVIEIWEIDAHINEPAFGRAVIEAYHRCRPAV